MDFSSDLRRVALRSPGLRVVVQLMPAVLPRNANWKWRITNSWEQQDLMRDALVKALVHTASDFLVVDP